MSETKTIFAATVYLKNGDAMRLCFSSFNQLCYHLENLDKKIVKEIRIIPSIEGMRQGRYDN